MMPGDAHYKAEHKKLTLPQQYSMMPTLPGRKGVGNHSHLLAPPNMAHILQVNCHSNPSEQPWWLFLFTEQERSRAVSSLLRHLGLWQWPSGFKTHADNSSSPPPFIPLQRQSWHNMQFLLKLLIKGLCCWTTYARQICPSPPGWIPPPWTTGCVACMSCSIVSIPYPA